MSHSSDGARKNSVHKTCTKDNPCRILIIEDGADFRAYLQVLLNIYGEEGFRADTAEKLSEGIAYLQPGHDVELILLDLCLPDSQGLDTLEAIIKQVDDRVPVVIVSATGTNELIDQAIEYGAQDYVLKDEIQGKRFTQRVRRAIFSQRARNRYIDQCEELKQQLAVMEEIEAELKGDGLAKMARVRENIGKLAQHA
jgi:DNA-binding NtrC family response regulator